MLRTRLNLREDQCTGAAKKKATHLVQEEWTNLFSGFGLASTS